MKLLPLILLCVCAALVSVESVRAQSVEPTPAPAVDEQSTETIDLPAVEGLPSVTGLSPRELFLAADIVVKAVMVILVLASIASWSLAINKFIQINALTRADRKALDLVHTSGFASLERARSQFQTAPVLIIYESIVKVWRESAPQMAVERCERILEIQIDKQVNALSSFLGFLASVGATAPFIGLFGTVWGVMNAFRAIAITKETSLNVVAPGIAEALLATAVGLFAAIPAVVFYNMLQGRLVKFEQRLSLFSAELVLRLQTAAQKT